MAGITAEETAKQLKFVTAVYAKGQVYCGVNSGKEGIKLIDGLVKISAKNTCAETMAIQSALKAGAKMKDIYIYTIRSATGNWAWMCTSCKAAYAGRVAHVFTWISKPPGL